MVVWLRVRRFFCDNVACVARTFAEQVAGLSRRYARRTGLLRRMVEATLYRLHARSLGSAFDPAPDLILHLGVAVQRLGYALDAPCE